MTPKIKRLVIEVTEGESIVNYAAYDDTGTLRAEVTAPKNDREALPAFVTECQEKAESVTVTPDQPEAFPLVWTPDGLQYAFGATEDSPVQVNLF